MPIEQDNDKIPSLGINLPLGTEIYRIVCDEEWRLINQGKLTVANALYYTNSTVYYAGDENIKKPEPFASSENIVVSGNDTFLGRPSYYISSWSLSICGPYYSQKKKNESVDLERKTMLITTIRKFVNSIKSNNNVKYNHGPVRYYEKNEKISIDNPSKSIFYKNKINGGRDYSKEMEYRFVFMIYKKDGQLLCPQCVNINPSGFHSLMDTRSSEFKWLKIQEDYSYSIKKGFRHQLDISPNFL